MTVARIGYEDRSITKKLIVLQYGEFVGATTVVRRAHVRTSVARQHRLTHANCDGLFKIANCCCIRVVHAKEPLTQRTAQCANVAKI